MSYLEKIELSALDYHKVKRNLARHKKLYWEVVHGNSKTLGREFKLAKLKHDDNGPDHSPLDSKHFLYFLREFKKHLHKRIIKNDSLVFLTIEFTSQLSRSKNTELWNSVSKDTFFYCVDLNSAYWQILFFLGYINEALFTKYKHESEYKKAKRLCVSFLGRNIHKSYFLGFKKQYEIYCDTTVYQNVFDNVRNYLYNIFFELCELVNHEYLEYTIDSITVCANKLDEVKEYLNSAGLDFKIILCKKLNDFEYLSGSKTKQFSSLLINKT